MLLITSMAVLGNKAEDGGLLAAKHCGKVVERNACRHGDYDLSLKVQCGAQLLHNLTHKPRLHGQQNDVGVGRGLPIVECQLQARLLREYGLEMEMSSGNYVLAMTSLMDRQEGFDRLSVALHEIDAGLSSVSNMPRENCQEQRDVLKLSGETDAPQKISGEPKITSGLLEENISPREIYRKPEKAMEIYEAEEAEHEVLPLKQAGGGVSAGTVFLYPPGIPVLVPGEWIDSTMANNLCRCLQLGLDVQGLTGNESISIVKMG